MAIVFKCDNSGNEVQTELDPLTSAPRLPEGWAQTVKKNSDGSITTRHFATPEDSLAWHEANPEE